METNKVFTFAGRTFQLRYFKRDLRQFALGLVLYNYRKSLSIELELGPFSLELCTPRKMNR